MTALSGLRAVLFDRDDTIAYTDQAVYRDAARWAASRYGLDASHVGHVLAAVWADHTSPDRESSWWHLRTLSEEEAFWSEYGRELTRRLELPADAAPEWLARFPYEAYMKPVSGARDVLSALRTRGLKIGVLSNTLPSIDRTLVAVGLADLIDVAIATCAVGIHKPEPGAYHHAAATLGVEPREILFIDDKAENVAAARAVGMQARLIDLSGQDGDAIHSLAEVLDIVDARWEAVGQ
ncbi:HAD family phosphatase [Deinococcus sp. KSM4-11]|uniref:HAD family hydrolase n=1 Tax=Deinococcus sp. KSM4-11 TaxID=2568654 RepID=UPI0010A2EE7E|nr:HAD family phosphatase [Deinococcus sp. KSM4-11]THF88322.1 HAD family phosphatase [Deinococcus sp. KSM4-11]